jgi:hypothetical protein
MTFARASAFLRSQPAFVDTADNYRLPKASRYIKFLRLFGFEITGSGPGMLVGRPSSSSGSSNRGGRPEGSIDIAQRVPRKHLPDSLGIILTPDNPYKIGTAAFDRYEKYKSAVTIGAVRKAGATPLDLRRNVQKGYGQLQ